MSGITDVGFAWVRSAVSVAEDQLRSSMPTSNTEQS